MIDVDTSEIPLIKRIIGLSGDTIEIKDNQVFISGVLLEEAYLSDIKQKNYGPVAVPDDYVFVMGDNRDASNDSRYFGPVPISNILSRAWFSYWPPKEIGLLK